MKINLKKYIKLLGNIVTIVAIIFVFKKLFSNDLDYALLFNTKNILIVIAIIIVQTLVISLKCFNWWQIVRILSGKLISFKESMQVYTKSNILKYIPGNVFQYVGRNELALRNDIKHVDVAFSTVLDVLIEASGTLILPMIFLFSQIITIFNLYRKTLLLLVGVGIVVMLIIVLVAYVKFKGKLLALLQRYMDVINLKNSLKIVGCFLYAAAMSIAISLLYMFILIFVLGQIVDAQMFFYIMGAYSISWLIGFLIPGAPAGMGIKEAVMLTIVSGMLSADIIALSLVTFRVLSIVSDVLAFAFGQLGGRIGKKKEVTIKN